ncbi:MAG: class I SAM-dependent methyltransferase [Desulfobacteraceae bacterium]|nr:MAG: class I SAM-dependent methyltransferase [Desulfobacteraceae bacterium]
MSASCWLKTVAKRLPIIKDVVSERENFQRKCGFVPPGHFYSPIPSLEEIERDEEKIFGNIPRSIPGIEMHEAEQLTLLEIFCQYYQSMPFSPHKNKRLRYFFENPAYSYSDAILLYCMIRHLQPKKIIEIGSGFSSCLSLDTNELFFNGAIQFTFIEPYPELLMSLIKKEDKNTIKIIPKRLQDVELHEFETLEANDILFIDSTHVSKVNSDVNRIFFEILPVLSPGVYIHFHDVFYPFEYPRDWIFEGRAWSEIYLLRTFLQYNSRFSIFLMNTYMSHFHRQFFQDNMPLCLKNTGGSIWIRKE